MLFHDPIDRTYGAHTAVKEKCPYHDFKATYLTVLSVWFVWYSLFDENTILNLFHQKTPAKTHLSKG